ncbi:hypothetical protein VF21_04954 [Pseudogymnoascus sp. 05NY08]|nr:hypothetical protein VF21_04954 [Pseudogymnoascus sp. 05NY08]
MSEESEKKCSDRKAKTAEVRLQFGVVDTVSRKTKHPVNNCLRGWALIKLSDDRFLDLPINILPPSHFSLQEQTVIMKIYEEDTTFPADVLSQPLSTVISMEEIEDVLKRSGLSDHKDRESMRVVKHGRTSGFTAGSLNEIRSDCYNGGFETIELVVVNIPGLNNFSFRGDSGSCVVDLDGRIIGLLHHGNDEKSHSLAEMTYVTPMAWILADIKDTLQTEDVVIPVDEEV